MSKNQKILVPVAVVVILVLAVFGIYRAVTNNVPTKDQEEAETEITQTTDGNSQATESAGPANGFEALNQGNTTPATGISSQPETGSNTAGVKNVGIFVEEPRLNSTVSSGFRVAGFANVFEGKVEIIVKDTNGYVLGQGQAIACMGYDACPFSTNVSLSNPSTGSGSVEVFSYSGLGKPEYLQTIPVNF